ncbi:hypothetical protein Q5P01_012717 [Channa striata]|uniref:Uncharacterized protein n=1 Tax=Channa striata TaxID=64152 RepID=A0AA88MQ29_CHASR|nr:hypothetical protein Q5P01_012717 [Channa striata]
MDGSQVTAGEVQLLCGLLSPCHLFGRVEVWSPRGPTCMDSAVACHFGDNCAVEGARMWPHTLIDCDTLSLSSCEHDAESGKVSSAT